MRLTTCLVDGAERVAIGIDGGRLALLPRRSPPLIELIARRLDADALRGQTEDVVPESDVVFLPPIPRPDKILAIGLNYRDHAEEAGLSIPNLPSTFARFASSQVGHMQAVLAPSNSSQFDYEGELAVIIGAEAWRVSELDAPAHIAGYSCFAENSVRDFQIHSRQVTPGKNFYVSGAFGPWFTTVDEVPDVGALTLITRLNGVEVQHGSLSDMVFSIPYLIAFMSSFTRLLPGDVIVTGTPAGIGGLRKPQLWMKPADLLEIEIPGVGLLANRIAADGGQ